MAILVEKKRKPNIKVERVDKYHKIVSEHGIATITTRNNKKTEKEEIEEEKKKLHPKIPPQSMMLFKKEETEK